jgi:prepilin-type N-terminal cleavage/methylation domain-containing protein
MPRTRKRRTRGGQQGFSLIELLVTMTTLAVAASMGLPALLNYMQRAKVEGAARQVAMLMYSTRLEAITRGAPAAVAIDEDTGELYAFVDIDGTTTSDPPDGIFNPKSGDAFRETDYELGRLRMPTGVRLINPSGDLGLDSVDGFVNAAPIPAKVAYFAIDGTIGGVGAFRVGDARGNFIEARVAAATTARVELRKWEDSAWREQAEGEEGAWKFN